jgi:nitrite reductase/ring-hydroxylating ferredoxin subunit
MLVTSIPCRSRRLALAALASLAALALAACSHEDAGGIRDGKNVVVKPGEWSVFDLHVGDCLAPPKDLKPGEIDKIHVVPCASPHRQEVFAAVPHKADAFPGTAALDQFASTSCVQELQTKLSVAPADGYFVSYLLPSFDSWNKDDDKTVTCVLVFPTEGEVAGSTVNRLLSATTNQPGAGTAGTAGTAGAGTAGDTVATATTAKAGS